LRIVVVIANYLDIFVLDFVKRSCLGGFSEWGTPVPIPNTEVKPFSADGTASIVVVE
jgi:hypothetical protein